MPSTISKLAVMVSLATVLHSCSLNGGDFTVNNYTSETATVVGSTDVGFVESGMSRRCHYQNASTIGARAGSLIKTVDHPSGYYVITLP